MIIIAPNRNDPLVLENSRPTLRFADVIESLVNEVNDLNAKPINEIADDFTLILTNASQVIRYTGSTNITITIPASTDVEFEVGSEIEIQNDGTAVITIVITTDTLTSSAGLGTGSRSIAADGDARLFLVALTNWKISGNQVT